MSELKVQSSLLLVSVLCFKCLAEVNKKVAAAGDHVLMAHQCRWWENGSSAICSEISSASPYRHSRLHSCWWVLLSFFQTKSVCMVSNHLVMDLLISTKADFFQTALCIKLFACPTSFCDLFPIFCHTPSSLQCVKVSQKGTNMTLLCPLLCTRETHLSRGRKQPVDYKQTPHGWSCKPITHPLLTRPRTPT